MSATADSAAQNGRKAVIRASQPGTYVTMLSNSRTMRLTTGTVPAAINLTRPFVTIWVVRVGDDLYVRSVRGRSGGWFRYAVQSLQGRIRAGGAEREPDSSVHPAIDDAHRTKYRNSPSSIAAMITPDATAATFRLLPR